MILFNESNKLPDLVRFRLPLQGLKINDLTDSRMKVGFVRPFPSLRKEAKPLHQSTEIRKPHIVGILMNLIPQSLGSLPHNEDGAIYGTSSSRRTSETGSEAPVLKGTFNKA